ELHARLDRPQGGKCGSRANHFECREALPWRSSRLQKIPHTPPGDRPPPAKGHQDSEEERAPPCAGRKRKSSRRGPGGPRGNPKAPVRVPMRERHFPGPTQHPSTENGDRGRRGG